jgi:hypothetical protein
MRYQAFNGRLVHVHHDYVIGSVRRLQQPLSPRQKSTDLSGLRKVPFLGTENGTNFGHLCLILQYTGPHFWVPIGCPDSGPQNGSENRSLNQKKRPSLLEQQQAVQIALLVVAKLPAIVVESAVPICALQQV